MFSFFSLLFQGIPSKTEGKNIWCSILWHDTFTPSLTPRRRWWNKSFISLKCLKFVWKVAKFLNFLTHRWDTEMYVNIVSRMALQWMVSLMERNCGTTYRYVTHINTTVDQRRAKSHMESLWIRFRRCWKQIWLWLFEREPRSERSVTWDTIKVTNFCAH